MELDDDDESDEYFFRRKAEQEEWQAGILADVPAAMAKMSKSRSRSCCGCTSDTKRA